MFKRQKTPVDTGVWMTTYTDMVTLLLCFFVLMYASSSMDRDKWQVLVKSLNPNATVPSGVINETLQGEEPEISDMENEMSLTDIKTFDQLYSHMRKYVEDNRMTEDVEVLGGAGYTFITFRNNILFDGNRYNLKPEGMAILDVLCGGIAAVNEVIKEMRILGHTNQADPNRQNDTRGDRFLASNRATEVLVYIQEKGIIEPKKLIGIGYGQFYPVAPFVREEDRLKNRRVEILITEANSVDVSLEYIYKQMNND